MQIGGRVVERSVRLTLQSPASGAPAFESRSDYLLVYFMVVPIDFNPWLCL